MSLLPALFVVVATLGLLAALATVLARNLVHAALDLVAFFFLVACLFVLLEAEFLAAVQVLVYIGAVAILLVFGIMLTRDIRGDETTTTPQATWIPAALVAGGLFALLAAGIDREHGPPLARRSPWRATTVRPAIGPDLRQRATPQARAVDDMGRTLGIELMGRYALPFQVAGLLLTAALVGSIALAGQGGDAGVPTTPKRSAIPRGVRRRHRAVASASASVLAAAAAAASVLPSGEGPPA